MEKFITISENSEAEIIEKKSKFIANLFQVQTVEEAENIIKQIRKKYHDAKHHCYAYRILNGKQILQKCSDDGEPSGTAGAPMLNMIEKLELTNVLIVVTRYFGGVLLGTGGLVKAYSEATQQAIEKVSKQCMMQGYVLEIVVSYPDLEKFKYFCKQNGIAIQKEEYLDNINLWIELSEKMKNKILEEYQNFNFNIVKSKILEEKYICKNTDI